MYMQTNAVSSLESSLIFAGNQFLVGILSILPSVFGALILFLLGWILADWLKTLTTKIVNITKLGSLFKNPAVTDFLKNAQVSQKFEDVIGEIVKWLVITLFFVAGINILGITSISLFLNGIIAGIPTLIAAVITLVIGVVVAGFLEKVVKGSLGSSDPSMARFVGKIVSYAVMTFFVLAALSQLGIASFFINTVFVGFIMAIALALGLSLVAVALFLKFLDGKGKAYFYLGLTLVALITGVKLLAVTPLVAALPLIGLWALVRQRIKVVELGLGAVALVVAVLGIYRMVIYNPSLTAHQGLIYDTAHYWVGFYERQMVTPYHNTLFGWLQTYGEAHWGGTKLGLWMPFFYCLEFVALALAGWAMWGRKDFFRRNRNG